MTPVETSLGRSFGWFVAVMGIFVLSQQIGSDLRHTLLTSPWTWASAAAAAGIAFSWYMLRRSGRTPEQPSDAPAVPNDENPDRLATRP